VTGTASASYHELVSIATVETSAAAPAPRRRGPLRPVMVPPDLLELHGPWVGELVLPRRLCWSLDDPRFSLADRDAVAAAYGYVLDAARTPEDLIGFVNPWLLIDAWEQVPMGRVKRLKWEAVHPVLRRHAAAATAA
jgi:hypothetical protein